MARLSKAKYFQIYEDHDHAETDTITHQKHIEAKPQPKADDDCQWEYESEELEEDGLGEEVGPCTAQDNLCNVEFSQDHRVSEMTSTSISSFPDSTIQVDGNWAAGKHSPPIIRPAFRRPQSVLRMQMSSPPPLHHMVRSSSRQSNDARNHGYSNTRSNGRHLPRTSESAEESESGDESRSYPLVLLHVTLLPVSLPWSMELMQAVLPAHILENLHLLRSKASETIVQRGILIPHPREEYELLEERLLQALDLEPERITKCGHFRSRPSTDSAITTSSSDSVPSDKDSGIGSSDSESRICDTCSREVKLAAAGTGEGKRLWSIRVFAANGLMRAAAWAAAWNEMESVDVEIFPWIDENYKRELNNKKEDEDIEEEAMQEEEARRIREIVEQEVHQAYEMKKEVEKYTSMEPTSLRSTEIPIGTEDSFQGGGEGTAEAKVMTPEFPPIYRASQIPISVLLKNYIYLLARDRKNVAIVLLALVALFLVLGPKEPLHQACTIQTPYPGPVEEHFEDALPQLPMAMTDSPELIQTTAMNMTEKAEDDLKPNSGEELNLLLSSDAVHLGEVGVGSPEQDEWLSRNENTSETDDTFEMPS